MSEEVIIKLQEKLQYLENLFNLNHQNVMFNFTLTWAIIGVLTAVLIVTSYFFASFAVRKSIDNEINKIRNELAVLVPKIRVGTWYENMMYLRPNAVYNKSIPLGLEPTTVKLYLQAFEDKSRFVAYEVDHQGIMLKAKNGFKFDTIEKTFFGKSILLNGIKLEKDKLVLSFKNIDKENNNIMNIFVKWEAIKTSDLITRKKANIFEVDLNDEI